MSAPNRLTLGTRGSALALWQARHVAGLLRDAHPDLEIEERIIRTEGDASTKQFGAATEKGVFVKEIEAALLDGSIDFAVHSLKDVPTEMPEGLTLVAFLERHDARDGLFTRDGVALEELPRGSTVGTGSFRRRCQILDARPDLKLRPIRGNVDTRLGMVKSGELDAIVLALAGVERLGLDGVPYRPISEAICLPAVGQGAVAVEIRDGDEATARWMRVLDHPDTRARVEAERTFLHRLGGGCLAPATGYATLAGGGLSLRAVVGDPDGRRVLRDRSDGSSADAHDRARALADRLLAAGARELLEAAREEAAEDSSA